MNTKLINDCWNHNIITANYLFLSKFTTGKFKVWRKFLEILSPLRSVIYRKHLTKKTDTIFAQSQENTELLMTMIFVSPVITAESVQVDKGVSLIQSQNKKGVVEGQLSMVVQEKFMT